MDKKYGNKYEVACSILDKLKQGGTGGGKFTLVDGIKLSYSTFTEVPENLDFSEVNDFSSMFDNCTNLTSIPQIDTSNATNFNSMFDNCTSLTSIPQIDTSNGTNFSYMFSQCKNLRNIPPLDTSNGTNFEYMFQYCNNLTTIPPLDLSRGTKFSGMFYNCTVLENISFVGSINYSIGFTGGFSSWAYVNLTDDSIKSILTACSKTTNTSSKTLSFKLSSSRVISDPNGEFATLIGSCTDKGWTITGLTLE